MVRNVAREVHMNANVGDRIVVESEAVGTPTREGEILEVVEGEVGDRFRVRWADGHETVFTPSGGSARIVPREPAAT
jgi:Domain of unknown function (DUF1918)